MARRSEPYLSFPQDKRDEVAALARKGFSVREICRRVGTHHHNVRPIVERLDAAGELPTHCPCGQLRGPGHKSNACLVSTTVRRGYPKVRTSRVPRDKINEIYRRLDEGQAGRRIAREVGVTQVTVGFYTRRWRSWQAAELPPCKCGRPARHPGGCIVNSPSLLSRDRVRQIEEWARAGLSAAEMARRSRKAAGFHSILKYATPVWEQMAKDGTFCGCGERRGHRGICASTWDSSGRLRGPHPIPPAEARRIYNALMNGDAIGTVRRNVPTSEKRVYRVLRSMSPADRHKRACLVYRRIRDDDGAQYGADLYQQVQAAVSRKLDPALRDEVVSELCLAVLQGDITLEQIRRQSKKFIGRAFSAWANSFGPRSLNDVIGKDGNGELLDLFGDDTALAGVDDMTIGAAW